MGVVFWHATATSQKIAKIMFNLKLNPVVALGITEHIVCLFDCESHDD